mgnify:CR=1 FL=1
MNNFNSEQILKRLNASQLKSLLKLTDTTFTSKNTKDELLEIALAVKEITPAIIVNHLKLDKFALEKKLNKPPPKPKVKKGAAAPEITSLEETFDKVNLNDKVTLNEEIFDESPLLTA